MVPTHYLLALEPERDETVLISFHRGQQEESKCLSPHSPLHPQKDLMKHQAAIGPLLRTTGQSNIGSS